MNNQKGYDNVNAETIVEVRYLQECISCPYQALTINPAITKSQTYINGYAEDIVIKKPEVICKHFAGCQRMQRLMRQKHHIKKDAPKSAN